MAEYVDAEQHDVAIVGYGPVGQLLAILLGRAGHHVTAIERWAEFYPLPRAVHFDHEVARILQHVGLRPDDSPAIEPYDSVYTWRNADRADLLVLNWQGVGPTGWHTANFFVQPEFEAQLDELARAQPTVSVQRGWEAVGIEQGPGGVTVEVASAAGERRSVSARYVIGADGANSFVRRAIDVPVHDLGFAFDWLIVDLVLHEERVFDPPAWQLCDPARPTTIVPGGPGRRRWEFMRLDGETIADLTAAGRAWELLAAWDVHEGNATIERSTVYTFQARWAERWREGRVLLAGDAAHLMPPFAGQGMCAGLRDAMNIAWKLDLVLRGRAGDQLLDTVGTERIPHVQHFIDMSIGLGRIICITDPAAAAERDAQMLAAQADPTLAPPPPPPPRLGPGALRAGDPAAGLMSIQAPVRGVGDKGLFDDVVGAGALLLASTAVPLDAGRREALATLGVEVIAFGAVPAAGVVTDENGAYGAWFAQLGADAVLVRPDFAVYGSATSAGVPRLVDDFLGAVVPG